MTMNGPNIHRRKLIASAAAVVAGSRLVLPCSAAGEEPQNPSSHEGLLKGKAEHVISIWLGGGMGQIDTFDPKRRGDAKAKKPGSYYDSIDTSVPGVQLCEHLKNLAPLMDHVTVVRTVHHDVIDEHAAATNRMHTGRPIGGTVIYPSFGSIISHELGAASDQAPPYVLIGYPNVSRGPGFLGSKAGYLYLTDTSQGPAGLTRPDGITLERQSRRERLLKTIQANRAKQSSASVSDQDLRQQYEESIEQSLKLTGPEFASSFQLSQESDELRNRYGGEFGQRCLLARRLVEKGVRFLEVSHNLNFLNGSGWDVHNQGIEKQHDLIRELDQAVATLILDLKERALLDKTLIVITTEFGRPAEFDSGGGRGHQGNAFSCVLAGGGLKHRGAFGETDELAKKIVSNPVSVPDFFATIHTSLGIDYTKNLYDGDRPVPITDNGQPISELFA